MAAEQPEFQGTSAPARSSRFGRFNSSVFSTFTSLRERDYAWYFAGNTAFFMAMQMQFLLRGFLAFEITGSAVALGYIAISIALPMLFVAPFGGVVADRVNKRTLLVVTQTAASVAALAITILVLTDLVRFWHLIVMSLFTGCVFSFNMPARQALVPNLVPQHKLMNAISLQMGSMNLTRIIAPALAGLLIGPLGIGWVYMITVALFVVATISELQLPREGMVSEEQKKSFKEDFGGGFRHIMSDRTVLLLLLAGVILPMFAFPVQQMLPVFAKDVFDEGTTGLGFLAAATGVGGLIGAIIAANFDSRPAKGRHMLIGGLAMGVLMFAFAVSPTFELALIFLALSGVGQMVFMATNNTVIQANLPPEVRGRVMAVMMMSFGLMPLGVVPVTAAADAFGAPKAVAISSLILLLTIVVLFAVSSRIRGLRLDALQRTDLSPVQAAKLVAEGRLTKDEAARLTGANKRGRSPLV